MDDTRPSTSQSQAASSQATDKNDGKDPNSRPKINKRTKTGCLTCRRRRIKCDEGRPVCNKCTKSKRHCDGYNQKVIFKNPYSSFPTSAHGPAIYPPGSSLAGFHPGGAGSSAQGSLQAIAPKPPSFHMEHLQQPQQQHHYMSQPPQYRPQPQELPQVQPDYLAQGPHVQQYKQETPFQQPVNGSATYYLGFVPGPAHHHPQPIFPDFSFGNADMYSASEFPPQDYSAQNLSPDVGSASTHYIAVPPETTHSSRFSRGPKQDFVHSSPVATLSASSQPTNGTTRPLDGNSIGQAPSDDDDVDDLAESEDDEPNLQNMKQLMYMQQIPFLKGLEDPDCRALFNHFVQVTGPCLSMYERSEFNDTATEPLCPDLHAVGPSAWSRTFPLMSLGHPALLHAIIAMSGLQMGNLGKVKPEIAYKQYSIAIRRLRRNAESVMRVAQPATLASALLLAYFDVWRSDHKEWCRHIYGARTVVNVLGLREMSWRCLAAKLMRQRQKERMTGVSTESFFPTGTPNVEQAGGTQYIDFRLLTIISGRSVFPEDYGVGLHQIPDESVYFVSDKDIQTYESFRDLFWWYCKMDVYQSILGATKLFMKYKEWTSCPPRAPVNRIDAIYGTYDHIILLLGKVADFAASDLPRKREVYKQRTGQGNRASPPFMGMLPAAPEQAWRGGFPNVRGVSSPDGRQDDAEPAMTETEALRQWTSIHSAFVALRSSLGPAFQPHEDIQSETENRIHPFGPPLQFKTFDIAGLWMNYYMGLIHLKRCHPERPPAMMHAARDAAKMTSTDARTMGRIATGLAEDLSEVTANDVPICAALIESAFCLFVAGIQYRKKSQREWLLKRMNDTTQITGWRTAAQIASGCESAWLTSFLTGDGPVHNPSGPSRVAANTWQTPRRLDQAIREARDQEPRRPGAPVHHVPNVQVPVDHADRAHYALGILGMESDMDNLFIHDD